MKLIAHRGNVSGPRPEFENSPAYIEAAIEHGFDCEIDVWRTGSEFALGHDAPQYPIDVAFLEKHGTKLWVHCKNLAALEALKDRFNCFFHDKDQFTLTSQNFIWGNVDSQVTCNTVQVMPDMHNYVQTDDPFAVCSDYVAVLRQSL